MPSPVLQLAVSVNQNITTDIVSIPQRGERDEVFLQVYIDAAATVDVQVRVDAALPFITVATITASTLQPIARFQQIQLVITNNTGRVSASLLV